MPAPTLSAPAVVGSQSTQNAITETYSKNILGPVMFELSNLNVAGSSVAPADPAQSQYIVASNEEMTISVNVKFNNSPLSKLLMCLGISVSANFGLEGIGKKAVEEDVEASIVTQKDVFEYTIEWKGTPEQAKLNPGLYEVGAVVTVSPGKDACAQSVFGYGYIKEIALQVYSA